jgi:FixJ family two-component response regulator
MMTEKEACVFVVDDDPAVGKAVGRLLRSMGYQVATFKSARDFLDSGWKSEGPSCLVLDIKMPDVSGFDLRNELASRKYSLPIVFITGHGDIQMSVDAMKKGAIDFLPKPFDDEQLLGAVREALEKDLRHRDIVAEQEQIRQRLNTLSPREREVLTYVIAGLMNKEIAYFLKIKEKTVIVHRSRVMAKMEVRSVAELVRETVKIGLEPARVPL